METRYSQAFEEWWMKHQQEVALNFQSFPLQDKVKEFAWKAWQKGRDLILEKEADKERFYDIF